MSKVQHERSSKNSHLSYGWTKPPQTYLHFFVSWTWEISGLLELVETQRWWQDFLMWSGLNWKGGSELVKYGRQSLGLPNLFQFDMCPLCPTWTLKIPFGVVAQWLKCHAKTRTLFLVVCVCERERDSLKPWPLPLSTLCLSKVHCTMSSVQLVWKWKMASHCRYIKTLNVNPRRQKVYPLHQYKPSRAVKA